MSWLKHRGQPSPGPNTQNQPVPMYNPNQHSNQNQWQTQQTNWYNQPKPEMNDLQTNYWNQNYNQQNYNNQNYQPSYVPTDGGSLPPHPGNVQYDQNNATPRPPAEDDTWNWGWGDEDNSNNVQNLPQPTPVESGAANPIADSFVSDTTWNWSLEDGNESKSAVDNQPTKKTVPPVDHLDVNGKRGKLETPQWSVESQLSQESSDDVLQTSESDKSHGVSRSSTISHSPGSGQEPGIPTEAPIFENKELVGRVAESSAQDNPYKRTTTVLSHKSANRQLASTIKPPSLFVQQPNFHPQTVNLETLPDNAEQPDSLPDTTPKRRPTPPQQRPDNNETPINDRNQYLETGQLEAQTDGNDTLPPPGLSRMVLGQNETTAPVAAEEAPAGLRRMIPGESSSPEVQRSETIGADTPPALSVDVGERADDTRPDAIEGRRDEETVAGLATAVRNLNVDDGVGGGGGSSQADSGGRKQSRQESSESEREARGKSPMDRRRYKEERSERSRRRDYSPDRKYERRRYRDRRYEEDTDYYSDREKERGYYKDDHDRKYSSLKKDKEKDRRKRDYGREPRNYPRDGRKNDYYSGRNYDDDYENNTRSRASDSAHDSYHEKSHHDRESRHYRESKDRRRWHRNAYDGYEYDYDYPMYSPYYQQYQYYENLRRTNPQAYAEWYRKYYPQSQSSQAAPSYDGQERASVHSGRSSVNDEHPKDRYPSSMYTHQSYYSQTSLPHLGSYYRGSQTHSLSGRCGPDDTSSLVRTLDQSDTSYNVGDQTIAAERLTPAKFAAAHTKASISSGKLLRVLPNYPLDGQPATVEICSLDTFLANDDDYQELARFPGPLVKGVTHKKTIIEYCENKIKNAVYNPAIIDTDSYILMWELLILLIRQNGMVVGADIAELLLKNRNTEPVNRASSVVSSVGSNVVGENAENMSHNENGGSLISIMKEEEVTNKFRECLLYGSGKEALELAMKHGLWGHALFLASKLDKRTYANVMMRFANGLTLNDPLQTLYQLLSGRMPAAVTCVADEKWGDWRPHLAMILSNSTQRPELNCKAITTMGDTLMNRGNLYAAQFCYLMAEVSFGHHKTEGARLVLLGANHNKPLIQFATNEAIQMTEIYEFARSLNDNTFSLPDFQFYKYVLSTRLVDMGFIERSLSYLEKISKFIVNNPTSASKNLIDNVCNLADRLKYYDPMGDDEDDHQFGDNVDVNRPDNSWLKELRDLQTNHAESIQNQPESVKETTWERNTQNDQPQHFYDPNTQNVLQPQPLQQPYEQQWNVDQQADQTQIDYQQQPQQPPSEAYYQQDQQPYWNNQPPPPQQQPQQWNTEGVASNQIYNQEINEQDNSNYYTQTKQTEGKEKRDTTEDIRDQQSLLSLPNQSTKSLQSGYNDEPLPGEKLKKNEQTNRPKNDGQKIDKTANGGWFGGIFNKLAPKPKNQMKLPDDKNPSIVWDQEKKRWINTDGDSCDSTNDLRPPPKMSEMSHPSLNAQLPPIPNRPSSEPQPINDNNANQIKTSNMFKLQRGRNLKKSYIDVFNPGSKPNPGMPQSINPSTNPTPTVVPQQQMNFFIPQPMNDPNAPIDFLTPAPPLQYNDNSQKRGNKF